MIVYLILVFVLLQKLLTTMAPSLKIHLIDRCGLNYFEIFQRYT